MNQPNARQPADPDDRATLNIKSELVCDDCSEGECLSRLEDESADWHRSNLRIDLHATKVLNSAALNRLIKIHRRVSGSGGRITLANAGVGVREVLELTRLERIFKLEKPDSTVGTTSMG